MTGAPERVETSPHRGLPLPQPWREAAVFGALWGAAELTVGTFLHATRIPLTGVFLSAMAVALLTASMTLVRRRWFPLRTALICAALRALSPEGLMPGPMAAIVFQGLLVSLAFIVLRKPLPAGIAAGFIAAVSTQVQGFVVKLVAYGVDFWELLESFLAKAEELLGLQQGIGWGAIALFLAILGTLGALGGAFGWYVGRTARRLREAGHA